MNNEVFEKALAVVNNRRVKAVQENDERISEINAKIPQIREINNELFNTGKELMKLIGSKTPDISDRIERLKKDNLEAQAMARSILTSNGYPSDYLDMHYTCPECGDTGYKNGCYCECLRKLCGKLCADELNKNARLTLSSFETFSLSYYKGEEYDIMSRILDFCVKYAENFSPSSESVFMSGDTGLGKTHLSLAIANKVLEKGYSVIYDSVINILRNIEKENFSREHSSEMIDAVMDAELLILDDLGTEYETPFYNSTVYNIINTRLNSGKPTIISTNLGFDGISGRYDARIVSRIAAVYKYLEFRGEDVRLQKRRNEN
ncbi:MAG: ATP-binding protein [Ruminococcus sp.]|nr:ATP-binding protein [Ruminococcus sp.]